jgi:hypothetical protein
MTENIGGASGAGFHGLLDVSFADAVAVADVHGLRVPAATDGLSPRPLLSSALRMPMQLIRNKESTELRGMRAIDADAG